MFRFNKKKKMISITFEGGDGVKNPELFKQGLKFVRSKVPIYGNVTVSDNGLTSQSNWAYGNYIGTTLIDSDLFKLNNIEIQIKFWFSSFQNGRYQLLMGNGNYGRGLGFGGTNQGQIALNTYRYPPLQPSYAPIADKIYYAIINITKSNTTTIFKLYDEDMNFMTQFTNSEQWFEKKSYEWGFGKTAQRDHYNTYANFDLKETWIKDLDTNEILVPWLE